MPKARLDALDTLRGLAVAGMILVDSPGSWSDVYPQLQHAEWHGWTLADMVFPGFLFAMGMATVLALEARLSAGGGRRAIAAQIMRRTVVLILIGLVLNGFPDYDFAHLRIPGILQRIALCYAATGAVVLTALDRDGAQSARAMIVTTIAASLLLITYGMLLAFVPVPGFGAGRFDSFGSWPAFVDRHVFTIDHLWVWGTTPPHGVTYDPEGLLSTIPAIATALLGVLSGLWFRIADRPARRLVVLAVAGGVLLAAGLALDPVVPIIKRIWTPSFVLVSGGFVLLVLAAVAWIGGGRWAVPLRVLGANAILAFALCQLNDTLCDRVLLAAGALRNLGFGAIHAIVPDAKLASLLFALATLAIFILILWPLYRRRLFLRV